jgi:hypothetical protein
MKSIDVRPVGHTINGRQNVSGAIGCGVLLFLLLSMSSGLAEPISGDLDRQLREILARHQFTGRVESTLEQRLGRPIDQAKAQLGGGREGFRGQNYVGTARHSDHSGARSRRSDTVGVAQRAARPGRRRRSIAANTKPSRRSPASSTGSSAQPWTPTAVSPASGHARPARRPPSRSSRPRPRPREGRAQSVACCGESS